MQPSGGASPQRAFWPQSSPGAPAAGGPGRALYCQICRLSCSGPQPWRQHLESARHMKMEADLTRRPVGGAADGSPGRVSSSSGLSVAHSDSPGSLRPAGARAFFCDFCQMGCTGPEPWRQHVLSAKHMKKASQEGRVTSDGVAASQSPSRPGSALSVDDVLRSAGKPGAIGPSAPPATVGAGGNFYCDICRLSCSGPEPWMQHVKSAKHMKKARQAGMMSTFAAGGVGGGGSGSTAAYASQSRSSSPSTVVSDDLQSFVTSDSASPAPPPFLTASAGLSRFCDVCQISSSGPEPWKQHIESGRHVKLASEAGRPHGSSSPSTVVSDDLQSLAVTSDSASPAPSPFLTASAGLSRFCDVCKISCSGPEPWKQHIESAKHLKLASQAGRPHGLSTEGTEMMVADTAPPRSACFSPMSGTGGSRFCDVCRISSSGPEPWKQHIESAKHVKLASLAGRLPTDPQHPVREVSSSALPVETEGPQQGLHPLNPFNPAAASDGVRLLRGPSAAEPVDSTGPDHDSVSSTTQTWGWPLQLPGASTVSAVSAAVSAAVSDGPTVEADGPAPQLRRPAAADVTSVFGSPAASFSGRSTPVSALTTGGRYACDVCQLEVTGPEPLQQHLLGAKHLKMAARRQHPFPGYYANSPTSSPTPAPAIAAVRPLTIGDLMYAAPGAYDRPLGPGPPGEPSPTDVSEACRSIRIGSWLHMLLDRKDGISEQDSLTASHHLRQLHVEGLVAFLEDTPLIRSEQPFSLTRC